MTENLLQKLEDKIMSLVTELEECRKEISRLHQENAFLRAETGDHKQKLQSLISVLDGLDSDIPVMSSANFDVMQGKEEAVVSLA